MDFEVPLNRLKFGQDDGAGINARVAGRQDGIAELAANIHARGQIENLVVKACGEDVYSVSNGNRRLAAFHMIYGETSPQPIRCTLRDVDEDGAFEDSLTTAVTARQLHPVDQYEAFARLRDKGGKSNEEIARQYGMTEREVEQALALGHLSPRVRELWRKGEIKTDVAKAFTLAPDHKAQEDILAVYAERSGGIAGIEDYDVKRSLKVGNDECGRLVEFVGVEAYVARGGKVTRDLFGTDHRISDPKLAKAMAAERLKAECDALKAAGWSFAVPKDSVRRTHYDYSKLKVEPAKPSDLEQTRLDELNAIFNTDDMTSPGYYSADSFHEMSGVQQAAYLAYKQLETAIELRAYPAKLMAKAGCFVGIDDDGMLEIEYGKVKPAEQKAAAEEVKSVRKEAKKTAAKDAASAGKPAPESTEISNALKQRLEAQLIGATRDAIGEEASDVSSSPLTEILAKVVCAQIDPDRPLAMPDAVRTKLPSLRQVIGASKFNPAIARRFDAADYFANAPKALVVKALAEAINSDEARKAATGHATTADLRTFALTNVGKTGWLPRELRTVHYRGPGSEGFKKPAAAAPAASAAPVPAKAKPSVSPAMRTALAKAQTALKPLKRAAAVRKTVRKTSAKKKPVAKKRRAS